LIRRSGVSVLLALALVAGGCRYGFSGGGLPRSIRTVAVVPFDNQTTTPDIQRDLATTMREEMQRRLGLREDSEARAHAVIRGTILRYDTDIPAGITAEPERISTSATRRRLQIAVDITIVDQATGRTLLERRGLSADGEYAESAELVGRRQAIDKLVAQIIDGIQSQW
jgi:hypothetical protein